MCGKVQSDQVITCPRHEATTGVVAAARSKWRRRSSCVLASSSVVKWVRLGLTWPRLGQHRPSFQRCTCREPEHGGDTRGTGQGGARGFSLDDRLTFPRRPPGSPLLSLEGRRAAGTCVGVRQVWGGGGRRAARPFPRHRPPHSSVGRPLFPIMSTASHNSQPNEVPRINERRQRNKAS